MILPLEPTGPPSDFDELSKTSRSITISWASVSDSHKNGIITGYRVIYRALQNGINSTVTVNTSEGSESDGRTTEKTLYGLNEFTNYSIRVLAFTVKGDGPPSVAKTIQTKEDSKLSNNSCHLIMCSVYNMYAAGITGSMPGNVWSFFYAGMIEDC